MKYGLLLLAFLILASAPAAVLAKVPNDPLYSEEQWYLDKVSAPGAWDVTTGSDKVVVAVLDAGVDTTHPDLEGQIWKNVGEIAGNGIDDDHNGFVDDVNGWDFVDEDNDPNPDIGPGSNSDAVSHGSLIAGLIGGVGDNARGIAGVAWNVTIMPVRMLDAIGSGSSTDAIKAIDYAVDNGADIINLSFSGDVNDPALGQAVKRAYDAGVIVVAALGNENIDSGTHPVYPACYGDDGENWVIGVAATDQLDRKASFSNYGDCADISAPGEEIYGVSYYDPANGYDAEYDGYWSGTSMSAPIVSGAAALLLSEYPMLSPEDVSTILKLSVDPLDLMPKYQGQMGAGRLNISRAFEYAEQYVASMEVSVDDAAQQGAGTLPGIQTGDVITTPVSSSVYYISTSTQRRAFINSAAYFTYFDSFDVIESAEPEDLAPYTLSGLVLPKPGVVLVKIQSDPRVYAIEENPTDAFSPYLREITSEEIAQEMYGVDWAAYVIDIEPTFFSKFTRGDEITSPIPVDTSIMKTREELAALAQAK